MAFDKFPRQRKRWFPRIGIEWLEERRVLASLAGNVFEDINDNGVYDFVQEPGVSGILLFVDANRNGTLDQNGFGMDPDEYNAGAVLNNSRQSVFPSATGVDNLPSGRVIARRDGRATSGSLSFGKFDGSDWTRDERLRFDFTLPVDSVSLETAGASGTAMTDVRLDAFGADGSLLASDTALSLGTGDARRLEILRSQKDISYVVAYVVDRGEASFDNLRADDGANAERATLSSLAGNYRFLDLPPGEVTIAQVESNGYEVTSPVSGSYTLQLTQTLANVNFGNRTATISGFVFRDGGVPGVYEPSVDEALPDTTLYLDTNRNGTADRLQVQIDPDVFLPDQVLEYVAAEFRMTTADNNNNSLEARVVAASDDLISQDGLILTSEGDAAWTSDRRLQLDFTKPASDISVDFIAANQNGTERGILLAYSASGAKIASSTTAPLAFGQSERLSISRTGFDIGRVVAYTVESDSPSGRLDNISAVVAAEPIAVSDSFGEFAFKPLNSGDYRVSALPVTGRELSFPEDDSYTISILVGETRSEIDFGFQLLNEQPVAVDDTANTVEDTPISIGVLTNDSDPDGSLNVGSVLVTQPPNHGRTRVTVDGLVEYTPDDDFSGTDSFLYTVLDDLGSESNSAVVTIRISEVNDSPIAIDDSASILLSSATILNVLRNDRDTDGTIDPTTLNIVTPPANATVTIDASTGNITYLPSRAGNDSFTYTVRDNAGALSNVATVTITSLNRGQGPTATADFAQTLEGTVIEIPVLANDSDADGFVDPETVTATSPPKHGTVVVIDELIAYQPDLGFVGQDTFSYQVRDDSGLASNSALVTVTITERDFPYQNPIDNLDVDNNGMIIPRDALIIINEINGRQISDSTTGMITTRPIPPEKPVAWMDVNGDGFIIARDVLLVINHLNQLGGAGEPDAVVQAQSIDEVAVAVAFSTGFELFHDDEDDEDAISIFEVA